MTTYYENTEQITKKSTKEYKFTLPEYGESTTDPTFYEPMATAISNMRNSAKSIPTLYDFEAGRNIDIEKIHIMLGRKKGLTQEEMSQIETNLKQEIKETSNQKIDEKNQKEKLVKDFVDTQEQINKEIEARSSVTDE